MSDFIVPDRSHLVAEYLLNGDARDTSGNGYHGSAADVQWPKTDRGYQTYAGEFNGSSSYVDSGDVLDFEKTDAFSIGFVGILNLTADANIVSKQMNSGSYTGYGIGTSGAGKPRFFIYAGGEFGGSIIVDYPNTVSDLKPHSLYVTYDGSNSASGVKLYLDGLEVSGTVIGNFPVVGSLVTSASFQISGRGGASVLTGGTRQSVRIFDVALSETEIRNWHLESLRALGGSTLAGLTDGTKHHFDFNGDANDIVGGFDGTAYSVSAVPDAVHGMAFSFNGTNAFVDASILPIPVNGDCTVYGWVKRNGTGNGTYNGMFNLQRGASTAGFGLFEGPGSTVYGFDGGVGVIDSTVTSSLGVWEFWGISRNSSGVKIYKNGSLVQTNVSARADGTSLNFLRVGTRENVTEFFNADMKLITVVNRELLPFEMLALYEISAKEKLLTFA